MRRVLLIPLVALGLGASWSSGVRAADQVTVTPDHATVTANDPTGYRVTLAGDTPASQIRLLLPSHGQPCGYPDTQGDPFVGGDGDTNWLVTDAQGGILTGRWLTWTGTYQPGTTIHISVVSPPLGGCFYAGATATAPTPVIGLQKGAQVFNDQDPLFGTAGTYTASSAAAQSFTVAWRMWNGTNHDVTLTAERLGARGGWSMTTSTFTTPHTTSRTGSSWTWREPLVIPANGEITETVSMTRPCGVSTKSLRLRIARSDGLIAGTGDGVVVPLAAC